jgi:hypothetical protein
MSFTRFKYDEFRSKEQNLKQTFEGRYQLEKPGPGGDIAFMEDPHLRLQQHGANLTTNKTDLESDFRGLSRSLNRDLLDFNDYKKANTETQQLSYTTARPYTQESRASHPAWIYKDLEQSRWELPFVNPVENIEIPFHNNLSSRIIDKDNFKSNIPKI